MIAEIFNKLAEEEGNGRGKFYPRPSLAGPDRCSRSMVYWALEYPPEPFPGRTYLIFDDGNWHEELSLDWLRRSAFNIHSEQMHVNIPIDLPFLKERKCKVKINGQKCGQTIPQGQMAGHIDSLFDDIFLKIRLLEHKSSNHFTTERWWSGTENPTDYFYQDSLYLFGLNRDFPEIKESILLIKNKNTASFIEYLIEYLPSEDALFVHNRMNSNSEIIEMNFRIDKVIESIRNKFLFIKSCTENKRLPKREYDIDDWHCEYCGWGKTCWEGYEKEFETFKTGELAAKEVKRYKQLGSEKSIITKQYDETRDTIKTMMIDNELKEAVAGDYVCKLTLTKDKKHRLYISKLKTKGI